MLLFCNIHKGAVLSTGAAPFFAIHRWNNCIFIYIWTRRIDPLKWLQDEHAAKWREEGQRYASDVNQFVHKGLTEGWDKAGKEPAEDTRGASPPKSIR